MNVRDSRGECKDTIAYVADVQTFTILVYDFKSDRSWIVNDSKFRPNNAYQNATIAGTAVTLDDGIMGLALSPRRPGKQIEKAT